MEQKNRCKNELSNSFGEKGHRRCGPSSYAMHNSKQVFDELKLQTGDVFLDLGCGAGDYSIQASKIVGNSGMVYALDLWQEMLDGLAEDAVSMGLNNLQTKRADLNNRLPIETQSADICFLATVLHVMDLNKAGSVLFNEIDRVLKPKGRLAIIECKKEERPFGPPMHMRNAPEVLEAIVTQYGFKKHTEADLGYNYMMQFIKK